MLVSPPAAVVLPLTRSPVFLSRCIRCGRAHSLRHAPLLARGPRGDDRVVEFGPLGCGGCIDKIARRRRSWLPVSFALLILALAMVAPLFESPEISVVRRPVRIVACIVALAILWWHNRSWRNRPRAEIHGDEVWFWFATEDYAGEFQRRNDGWRA